MDISMSLTTNISADQLENAVSVLLNNGKITETDLLRAVFGISAPAAPATTPTPAPVPSPQRVPPRTPRRLPGLRNPGRGRAAATDKAPAAVPATVGSSFVAARRVRPASLAIGGAVASGNGNGKREVTPEQLASRQLQGKYLGLLRQIPAGADKERFQGIAKDPSRGRKKAMTEMKAWIKANPQA